MIKQILFLSLVCSLLGLTTGCQVLCWPYGCGQPCSLFGNTSGPCGMAEDCSQPCGMGSNDCGLPCGFAQEECCPLCRPEPGPLSWLFNIFSVRTWCGRSCGGAYYGDFYSDPPDINDPCDCHGNYTGGSCPTCSGGSAFDDPFGDNVEMQQAGINQPVAVAKQTVNRQQPTLAQRNRSAKPAAAVNGDRIVATRKVSETTRVVTPAQTTR
jgi:hypothetical protein